MENKKVISRKNLPVKPPVVSSLVFILALDYWNAPQWLWGAVMLLLIILWISAIHVMLKENQVDIMSEEITSGESKPNFKERLEQLANEQKNK